VFARRTTQPGRDVALGVLWDLSSSMNDGRTEMAAATVWQLAQAAEGAGAGFGVYGFSSMTRTEPATGPHGLLLPIWPFGTRPAQPARTLANVFPRGGTRLAPCLLGMAQVMLDVPASRRILLVLTDGGCDYGHDMVRDACTLARQWGVEPVGLGIQAEEAVEAFPKGRSVNVDTLTELGRTGMRVLADLLEEGAAD
jgi:Mg-chelatase subunit ChlD